MQCSGVLIRMYWHAPHLRILSLRQLVVLHPVLPVVGQHAPYYLKHVARRHNPCLHRAPSLADPLVYLPHTLVVPRRRGGRLCYRVAYSCRPMLDYASTEVRRRAVAVRRYHPDACGLTSTGRPRAGRAEKRRKLRGLLQQLLLGDVFFPEKVEACLLWHAGSLHT